MKRAMLEFHLEKAERHVATGERNLASQRRMVTMLRFRGESLVSAETLLRTFEQTQRLHVADRNRISAELAAQPF